MIPSTPALYQGMTSVVPQNAQKMNWALAPATFRTACGLFFSPFPGLENSFFSKIPT
jgi:hypothetical protein